MVLKFWVLWGANQPGIATPSVPYRVGWEPGLKRARAGESAPNDPCGRPGAYRAAGGVVLVLSVPPGVFF